MPGNVAIIVNTNVEPEYVPSTSNVLVISSNIADLSAESVLLLQDGTLDVTINRRWVTGMDEPVGDADTLRQFWYIS